MDVYINQLKKKYDDLAPRERIALVVMAIFLVIFLIYKMIWQSAVNYRDQAKSQYESQAELYQWISQNELDIRSAVGQGRSNRGGNQSLISYVTQTARAAQLTIGRYEPRKENQMRLSFQNVKFESLIQWLVTVNQDGVTVTDLTIDKTNTPGLVRSNLTLSR